MTTINAKCEAVARYQGGQEVRFYRDSVCVKTLHLAVDAAGYDSFVEGQDYDVEVDLPSPPPPPVVEAEAEPEPEPAHKVKHHGRSR